MNTNRVVAVLFIAVFCLTAGAAIVSANDTARGEPDIEAYAPETAFVPGEEASLDVTFNNRGHLRDRGQDNLENDVITAQSATATLLADEDDVPFDVRTGTQPIGDIGEGVTGPISFTVVPDADAEPGVYEVPIELEYRHAYRAELDDGAVIRSERDETEVVHVEVEITDDAQFAVVNIDGDIQAGVPGTVDVTMRNVAEQPAREASVTANPVDGDISFTSGTGATNTYVEEWESGENRTFTYRIDADGEATQRPSTFELDVSYRDVEGADTSARTVRTGITPLPEQSFSAESLNSSLRVGEDGTFEVLIENDGPRAVDDVVVVFDNEAPAIEGVVDQPLPADPNVVPRETQAAVGTLGVGENATVTFEAGIRTDAAPGDRVLNIATRYRTVEGDLAVSEVLDVVTPVAEEQDVFAVSPATPNATEPANATPGETVRYDVVVRNDGDESIEDIQAKLFVDDPLDTDDDEAFVTGLEPGEETTVSFAIEIDDSASIKSYAASIDFRYTDHNGDEQLSDTYRLPVDVVSSDEEGFLALLSDPIALLTHPISLIGIAVGLMTAVYKRGRLTERMQTLRTKIESWNK